MIKLIGLLELPLIFLFLYTIDHSTQKMKPEHILLLSAILVIGLALPVYLGRTTFFEPFTLLDQAMGPIPDPLLVQDTYPPIGKNQLSNDTSERMWWHYPTFQLGSYEQITNNIRYPYNPDIGQCMPGAMCGALYHDNKNLGDNHVYPLPPASPEAGTRVGYFSTENQLVDSLPFRTNLQNILY